MTFEEILDQALDMLRRRGRVTYGALKRQFALDDAYVADLKDAMLYADSHVVDDAGRWRSVPADRIRREARRLLQENDKELARMGAAAVDRFLPG